MIIIPSKKIIEPNREISRNTELSGWWKLSAVKKDTGVARELTDWFPNIITDVGLNRMGTATDTLGFCGVGTGSTAPTAADTGLVAAVGARTGSIINATSGSQASEPYYGWVNRTYRFGEGVAEGNLSEIGIFNASTSGIMWSRALILDGLGDPTTITVLDDEYLDATYQLRIYPPLTDIEDEIIIGGVTYNYTLRASSVTGTNWHPSPYTGGLGGGGVQSTSWHTAHAGVIGSITSSPAGVTSGVSQVLLASYADTSLERAYTLTWDLVTGNIGGIRSVTTSVGQNTPSTCGRFQIDFGAAIPKDGTKILSLEFKHAWGRRTL
jgi:hypothetical protein